jgi:hypothetical protein
MRMPRLLITTPINTYIFSHQLDTAEDFFMSYPALSIHNDTLYFKGSSKVLLLLDGIPISSLKDISFPLIEKVEVVAQDISSLYGDYDAVINIVTKRPEPELPYSKLNKTPDYVEFEFGNPAFCGMDFYLAGDINSTTKFNFGLGYNSKFASVRAYYINELMLQGSLFSNTRFYLKQDFFSLTNLWALKGALKDHKFLFGTDNLKAFLIQDYWEPYPLLYVVPGIRWEEQIYPKISVGFVPSLNTTVFASLTPNQQIVGIRVFDSAISGSRSGNKEYGAETIIYTPKIWNFKFSISSYITSILDYKSVRLLDNSAIMVEYQKDLKQKSMTIFITGSINTLRAELKIIDVKFFYRLKNNLAPSYGLSWEFLD